MSKYNEKDIAVVGMACQFPDASDHRTYWKNLLAGKKSIREIPADRWDIDQYYCSEPHHQDKSISKWCGLIDDIKSFDNEFFNISPAEAKNMDPQQRLLLQESWRCIEDSAIPLKKLQDSKTSVYVGAMTSDYLQTLNKNKKANNRYSILGNDHCILANRISHQLNLSGESISINAASASSLVAIHKAKSALVLGECDYAIAAGVNLNTDPLKYIVFSQAGMLSPDGQCKSFSDDANGYVPGDGVAAVLLQPLSQALKNGHHIYGIIKGSAINHIGSGKSITAPCSQAQANVISEALNNAGKNIADVGYIEAHGSGTPLGDPIEIEALSRVYEMASSDVIVGTVKPSIGHLEAAAGIAGLIKSIYVLNEGYVPANLNLRKINPVINLSNSPLKLSRGHQLNGHQSTCAGVSSFGFGGVSCHVILQKHDQHKQPNTQIHQHNHFILSAKSLSGLNQKVHQWQQFLKDKNSQCLTTLCANVTTGRQQFEYRLGCVVDDHDELLRFLKQCKAHESACKKELKILFAELVDMNIIMSDKNINEQYRLLIKQIKRLENYDQTKVSQLFNNEEFVKILALIAIYRALQQLNIEAEMIDFNGHLSGSSTCSAALYAGLICAGVIDICDYIDYKLSQKNWNDVVLYQPHIPIHFNGQVFYPSYMNIAFLKNLFREIDDQKGVHKKSLEQANILLHNNQVFAALLSQWCITDHDELIKIIKQANTNKGIKLRQLVYAIVAVNVCFNQFYKKWMFDCKTSGQGYYAKNMSTMINENIISINGFHDWCFNGFDGKSDQFASINRKFWPQINRLLCDKERLNHRQIMLNQRLFEGAEFHQPINQDEKLTISLGQSHSQPQFSGVHPITDAQSWANALMQIWLSGRDINWQGIYPHTSFNRLSLPTYIFDKQKFWPSFRPSSEKNNAALSHSASEAENFAIPKQLKSPSNETVIQGIKNILSNILELNQDTIDVNKSFEAYGCDSMAYTLLSEQINSTFSTSLTPACFFGFRDIDALISSIMQQKEKSQQIKEKNQPTPLSSKKDTNQKDRHNNSDIAIVGYAGKLPKSTTLDEFWNNLVTGVDGISEIPASRWDWQKYFSQDIQDKNKSPSKWGGFIDGIGHFDAAFFGISPQEAKLMDPQQRLVLQAVWHAIEHAGHQPSSFAGTKTGVFIGASTSDYEELIRFDELAAHASTGMNRSIIANRVSFILDVNGPSEVIDTACSSSMIAIHKAVEAIKAGDCETALAGGVNALITPTHYISYGKAGMLSPDGRCKTFDESANGYVRSEGVGIVLLKSLKQARRDKNTIHAVIKATGMNHGGRANSLTAPNPHAQAQLIINTYRKAGISSGSIDYIENHGTGTPLGDPIEINGLQEAFKVLSDNKTQQDESHKCYLASVKSNIGHLEAAAGIAGVLKVILSLKNEMLPASLHLKQVNPYIDLDQNKFEFLASNRQWPKDHNAQRLRRAGISSFGFGGVNGHVVLEEYIQKQIDTFEKPQIIIISAKNDSALKRYAAEYLRFLKISKQLHSLANMAYTWQIGRDHQRFRLAICVKSIDELNVALKQFLNNNHSKNIFYNRGDLLSSTAIEKQHFSRNVQDMVLTEVAKLWTQGLIIDWKLWQQNNADDLQRVPLPTYPFEKKYFWVNDKLAKHKKTQHSSAVNNARLFKHQKSKHIQAVEHTIEPDHFIASQHVVNQQNIAPGVFSLSLLFQKIQKTHKPPLFFKDVFFKTPLPFEGQPVVIKMAVEPFRENHKYCIYLDNKKTVTEVLLIHQKQADNSVEMIKIAEYNAIATHDLYEKFKNLGFEYGEQFKVIQKIMHNGQYYLSQLRSDDTHINQYDLDPRLLDGALQTCLAALIHHNIDDVYIPMMIDKVICHKPLPETVFAVVRPAEELIHDSTSHHNRIGADTQTFDIDIVDKRNQLLVHMSCVVFKKMPGIVKTKGNKIIAQSTSIASSVKHSMDLPVQTTVKKIVKKSPKVITATVHENNRSTKNHHKNHDNCMENKHVNTKKIFNKTIEYLVSIIAETASLQVHEIDTKQSFKEYGIDSFLTLSIIRNLENDFGDLRKTLLFEASNVEELAEIFVNEQQKTLLSLLNIAPEKEQTGIKIKSPMQEQTHEHHSSISDNDVSPPASHIDLTQAFADNNRPSNTTNKSSVNRISTDLEPIVISEVALQSDTKFSETVTQLFKRYGAESSALSRKNIAPLIFIPAERKSLFYFNVNNNILLAFRYVGSEDYFESSMIALKSYCDQQQWQMNVLCEYGLNHHQFSANPFAVVQRLTDLSQFTISGSQMRRLRYHVNKFQKSGQAEIIEYCFGDDTVKDTEVNSMIEKWASHKTGVNPYIWRVKDEMETGCLSSDHRIFLTYLDQCLQNVIIISRIESDNSYLLDTEFYSTDMAPGAMDFAICEIIKKLMNEGCRAFSLGLTFGSQFYSSHQADLSVSKALVKLAEDGIFEEAGNYQFKNKYRCVNSPIYLYRDTGQNASNVLDIIMMIGNPRRPYELNVQAAIDHKIINEQAPQAMPTNQHTKKQAAFSGLDKLHLSDLLKEAGYNPFNIDRHHIEYDLATDSWSELEYDFIIERTRSLQQLPYTSEHQLESLLSEIFALPYVLPFSSGRVAESFFCPAWPKDKKYVLQNVLFPTCLFHQINNDFMPIEIPQQVFYDRQSNDVFKGNMDCQALKEQLQKYSDDIAFVWVEMANNAAGGCPVSLSNLREIKSCIGEIPLVLDVTRIVENAFHISQYEAEYLGHDVWEIVSEICALADVLNGSLTKDFGTHIGGFIALRDESLYAHIQDAISTNGSGLSRTDHQLLCHAVSDKSYIESRVKHRMEMVELLAHSLLDAGLTVIQPVGGHCVLIDPFYISALHELHAPLPSFLAWMFKNTGIRAGIHSVGRQRNTSMNNLIRLAIPVGISQAQIEQIAKRLIALFNTDDSIDDLQLHSKPQGLFGDVKARYTVNNQLVLSLSSQNDSVNQEMSKENSVSSAMVQEPIQTMGNTVHHDERVGGALEASAVSDIAVIGMSGRYPDAQNVDELWQNLKHGKDSIKMGPKWQERFVDANTEQHYGGFIDDVDKFDSLFFNISPREAQNMDPQERLVMEVSWQALEDAGYHPDALCKTIDSRNIGVFIGAVWSYYEMLGAENCQSGGNSIANSQHWGISNRISSFMNFNGPSLTVDTACSSSLTAIHLACESLKNRECKVAIAGGVNLDIHPNKHRITKAAQFLSDEGLCKAFGKGGTGYVAGEGVGTLVLKPLQAAKKDGDHIYGVIKSSSINHGGRTAGYTVPNPNAQADLIRSALDKANIEADTISYIEAHGTGTELGDPVEIQGASKAFRADTDKKQYCSIGSIKTNIGHLEAAAGIAGATKLLLQMKHKQLIPSLHSSELNEYIDFDNSPFYVQQHKEFWHPLQIQGQVIPRRAGLSSFGAGGTNVHVIFEEYEQPLSHDKNTEQELIILSAKKDSILKAQAQQLLDYLDGHAEHINLNDMAYTLQVGRLELAKRMAVVVEDIDSLINGLKSFLNEKSDPNVLLTDNSTKLALDIFDDEESNQIIQVLMNNRSIAKIAKLWVNGVDINWQSLHTDTQAKRMSLPTYPFAKVSHWIDNAFSHNRSQNNFNDANVFTEKLHPLLDSNCSTFNQLEFQKQCDLQQYVFSDHIVDELPTLPGVAYMEMARIAAEKASGYKVNTLRNMVWASPINSQSAQDIRIKLYNKTDYADFEICTFEQDGKKNIHAQGKAVCSSSLLVPAIKKDIQSIKNRCHGTMTKKQCYDLLSTRKLKYGEKLQSIERFQYGNKEGLTTIVLPADLVDSFNEYDAHPSILDGAVQSIICLLEYANTLTQPGVPYVPFVMGELNIISPLTHHCYAHLTLNESKKERDDIKYINIDVLDESGQVLIQMKDFSFKAISEQTVSNTINQKNNIHDNLLSNDVIVYQPHWKKLSAKSEQIQISKNNAVVLLAFDESQLHSLKHTLNDHTEQISDVILAQPAKSYAKLSRHHYQLNPNDTDHIQDMIDDVLSDEIQPVHFIHHLSVNPYVASKVAIGKSLNSGLLSVFVLSQTILKNKKSIASKNLSISYIYHTVDGLPHPGYSSVNGFMRSIKQEGANINCQTICVSHEEIDWSLIIQCLGKSIGEFKINKSRLLYKSYMPLSVNDQTDHQSTHQNILLARENGVYLITGGMGGLGLIFAREMSKAKNVTLILTGRSELNETIKNQLQSLNSIVKHIEYCRCDLTKEEQVQNMIDDIHNRHGDLNGVIHAAGIIKDGFLWNKKRRDFLEVVSPKILGTHNLDDATKKLNLDYLMLCSSIASTNGNMGQSDYAAGNRFMDDFAELRELWRQKGQRKGKTLSINWPLWKSGGMQVNEQAEKWLFDNWGMKPLQTEVGLQALHYGLTQKVNSFGILQGDVEKACQALNIDINIDNPSKTAAAPLTAAEHSVITKNVTEQTAEIKATLVEVSNTGDMIKSLKSDLMHMVMNLLKIQQSDIDFTENMSTYGFDSVTFTEFANVINQELEIDVTPLIFFEQETLDELTNYLLEDFSEPLKHHYAQLSTATSKADNNAIEASLPDSETQSINSTHGTHIVGSTESPHEVQVKSTNQSNQVNNFANKSEQNHQSTSKKVKEPIAIVGLHGVMPQSENAEEFWSNLINEKNLISEIPKDRWDWKKFWGESDIGNSKTMIKWGGFMPEVDKFDAEFFNISPLEAEQIDPQQRIFLQSVWHAIEDAGYKASELSGTNTGVFVGIGSSDYHELLREQSSDFEAYSVAGWMHAVLANRISYFFNFSGASEPIGTACSSTLVAVDRAVQAIRNGQCDMCIAGGVSMLLNPGVHIGLGKASMLADDGRCKTFDHKANGYVRSEGVGSLLLKPLSKAEADGDHIYAVIKGSAVNHGGLVNTFTTPNPKAQADVLNLAFEDAEIDPATLTYMETHGTGTALGDPIEIQGLIKAFKRSANKSAMMPEISEYCTLGSVKTNAGHLELASGMAGILKLILALKNKKIPANINFEKINPYISLDNTPFRLAEKTADWQQIQDIAGNLVPRRAGISSFGFGGVNAHVIMEEYTNKIVASAVSHGQSHIVPISTKYNDGLKCYAQNMIDYLDKGIASQSLPSLDRIAAGFQQGREAFNKRLAIVAKNVEELRAKLQKYCNGQVAEGVYDNLAQKKLDKSKPADLLQMIANKDIQALAKHWVRGVGLDWIALNPMNIRVPSLPHYPFQKNRYWLLDNAYTGAITEYSSAQLSDSGISLETIYTENSDDLRFSVLFDNSSFYLEQHKIAGQKLLPAAAYLELVNYAVMNNLDQSITSFRNIRWLKALTAESIADGIVLSLQKYDDHYAYIFYSQLDNNKIYATGKALIEQQQENYAENTYDFDVFKEKSLNKQQIYQWFSQYGFDYGDQLKVIEKMSINTTCVYAQMRLPSILQLGQNSIHTVLIDGALQTILGILLKKDNKVEVPVAVAHIDIDKSLTESSYVKVAINDNDDYDITIYNNEGQLSMRFLQVVIQPLAGEPVQSTEETPDDNREDFIKDNNPVTDESVKKQNITNSDLKAATLALLAQMIAEETRRDRDTIEVDADFSGFGIDSFLALRMTKKLEKVTGPVMKTVFFEHTNLNSLSDYLIAEHGESLAKNLDIDTNKDLADAEFVETTQIGGVNSQDEQDKQNEQNDSIDPLKSATIELLAQMIAEETRRDRDTIEVDADFNGFGIDSFLALRMTKKLEKVTGPVMKTVFFEHTNLNSLSDYLIAEHGESLTKNLDIDTNKDLSDAKFVETTQIGGVNSHDEQDKQNEQNDSIDPLKSATIELLAQMIAEETRRDRDTIEVDADFNGFGIDSFLALRMTKKLEKVTGPVMKTVFFEHTNLNSLSDYLIAEHGESLTKNLDIDTNKDLADTEFVETTQIDDVNSKDEQDKQNEQDDSNAPLKNATIELLAQMIAEETRRDRDTIEVDADFNGFGIDSFLALRMTKKLEKVTGPLMKTVFFEHTNLNSLGDYLIAEHGDSLAKNLDIDTNKDLADAEFVETTQLDDINSQDGQDDSIDPLKSATIELLAQMIAEETRRDRDTIEVDADFNGFGIDSFLALRMTKKLEKVTGPVMKTVFFEHNNLNSLSDYLIAEYSGSLLKHLNLNDDIIQANKKEGENQLGISVINNVDQSKNHDYEVIKESELSQNSLMKDVVDDLCQRYGKENKALARYAIAPYIFLASNKKSYFNFNHNGEVAIAFTFVGPDEELHLLAHEFTQYCRHKGLMTNMLTEQAIDASTENSFSANPFGLMQRISDIQSITLRGTKMRRLRYHISKFQKSGQCEFFEYSSGSDAMIDKSIASMIDDWADNKDMINPYIWEVKALISKGQLPKEHRIFLTKLDNKLQNVIILTELAPKSGYLMDLEFYSSDMPMGGLEYAIWNIIQTLSEEGYQDFSLGATFGVNDGQTKLADPSVMNVLDDLQNQGAFDGKGNMQFKNKFRPVNKTLYISRPMSDDAQSVVDVIMLIANPYVENRETLQSGK